MKSNLIFSLFQTEKYDFRLFTIWDFYIYLLIYFLLLLFLFYLLFCFLEIEFLMNSGSKTLPNGF